MQIWLICFCPLKHRYCMFWSFGYRKKTFPGLLKICTHDVSGWSSPELKLPYIGSENFNKTKQTDKQTKLRDSLLDGSLSLEETCKSIFFPVTYESSFSCFMNFALDVWMSSVGKIGWNVLILASLEPNLEP